MIASNNKTERNKMNAATAIKAMLQNSEDINITKNGEFIVWDQYGMIIGNYVNKDLAVDALFKHYYEV